jgi:hypothetical protein
MERRRVQGQKDKWEIDYEDRNAVWEAECKAIYDNWGQVYNAEEVKWELEYNAEHVKWEVEHIAKVDLLENKLRELEMKNLYRPKELDLDYQLTFIELELEKQIGFIKRETHVRMTANAKKIFILTEFERKHGWE